MIERDPFDSYAHVMKMAQAMLENDADYFNEEGKGGMVTLISADSDGQELDSLLQGFAGRLGIEATDVEHVDVGRILNAFELGFTSVIAEIPVDHLNKQDPIENTFEYIFRGFGKNGEGWRNSFAGRRDELLNKNLKLKESIGKGPIADFLRTIDIDLDTSSPRMLVLHYPSIEDIVEVFNDADVEFDSLSSDQKERLLKSLDLLAIVFRAYPHMYRENNPQRNVVVNVIDPLYKWYRARTPGFNSTYERMGTNDVVMLPSATDRDLEIRYSPRS